MSMTGLNNDKTQLSFTLHVVRGFTCLSCYWQNFSECENEENPSENMNSFGMCGLLCGIIYIFASQRRSSSLGHSKAHSRLFLTRLSVKTTTDLEMINPLTRTSRVYFPDGVRTRGFA